MKLNEKIAAYRKELGWTQEELAGKLGVTGQSVSKWESGICCPDIQLLPTIADLFHISLDTLFGHKSQPISPDFPTLARQTRTYMESLPAEHVFRDTFRLTVLLHEILCTDAYRKPVPWDADGKFEDRIHDESPHKWGTSITSLPDGTTVYSGSGIFFGYNGTWQNPQLADMNRLAASFRRLADADLLCVLFALYSLTYADFDHYVTAQEIAEAACLPLDKTTNLLDNLPLTVQRDETGCFCYRLDGAFMHLPPLFGLGGYHNVMTMDFR